MGEYIPHILTFLVSGGLTAVFTLSSTRNKAKAEAKLSMQTVYIEMIDTLRKHNELAMKDIEELRGDLKTLREEVHKLNVLNAQANLYKCTMENCKQRQL